MYWEVVIHVGESKILLFTSKFKFNIYILFFEVSSSFNSGEKYLPNTKVKMMFEEKGSFCSLQITHINAFS